MKSKSTTDAALGERRYNELVKLGTPPVKACSRVARFYKLRLAFGKHGHCRMCGCYRGEHDV